MTIAMQLLTILWLFCSICIIQTHAQLTSSAYSYTIFTYAGNNAAGTTVTTPTAVTATPLNQPFGKNSYHILLYFTIFQCN
jgi:hypothetical protein